MKLQNNHRLFFFIITLGFFAGVIIIFFTQNSYGGGDHFSHFKLAHWGWKYPSLLFNHWGKPVFTILISPFAQFGINGVRIYNLLMGFSTALIVWKLALIFNFKNSVLSLLLVLFTPVYFILMFTALTEVSFSFFLALAVLLFFRQQHLFSAVVLSFLPLVRTEGIVLFPLFMIAYNLRKQWLALPLLTTGFWLISLLGFPFYDDFWWLITKMPYSGSAIDIYGSGPLLHFINDTRGILGYPLAGLFMIGLATLLVRWFTTEERRLSQSFYFLLLIPGSFLTFLAAHSFVWWQGMGNSLGLIRVIGSVTPFAALTALPGFNYLLNRLQSKNKQAAGLIITALLVLIVLIGINKHRGGFKLSKPQQLVGQAADYLQENKLDKYKLFYFNSYLVIKLGIDPYDQSKCNWGMPNKLQPAMSVPDSGIIVWDAHFGPNEGKLPLNRLKNSKEFTLLKVIRPIQPFKVLGDYDYAVYIFQKISGKNESIDTINKQPAREFFFDFEDLDIADSTLSYSGKKSLRVTSHQEYINFVNHPISEFQTSISSLKIDISAAFISTEKVHKEDVFLVCTLEVDGETKVYQTFDLFKQMDSSSGWNTIRHTFKIYIISSMQDNLKLYLWNKGKINYSIDAVKVKVSPMNFED